MAAIPKTLRLAAALGVMAFVAIVDLVTGYEISTSLFYLFPVAFVAWTAGLSAGAAAAVLAALLWLAVDFQSGHTYSSWWIGYWNSFMRGIVFFLAGFLVAKIRELVESERDARDAAEAASKAKTSFLADMSHDIRTPMNALLGSAELLSSTRLDDSQKRLVGTFQREGHHLLSLIDEILDLSKLEAGKVFPESIPVDIVQFSEEIASMMGATIRGQGLEFRVTIESDIAHWCELDPTLVKRVLFNLLGNAAKFTESGYVEFSMSTLDTGQAKMIEFVIADSGIGIDEKEQARLFQPFSQANTTISRRFQGSGLGLELSRRIVETLGGSLNLASRLGSGTQIHVIIPMKTCSPATERATPAAESQADSLPTILASEARVLLVEDYDVNRQILRSFLSEMITDIDEAGNGEEAVAMFEEKKYDLVFMDLRMPKMDGLTAVAAMREVEARLGRERVPIVALTAQAYSSDARDCLAAGFTAHMAKPVTKSNLLRTAHRFLASNSPGSSQPSQAKANAAATSSAPVVTVSDGGIKKFLPVFLKNVNQAAEDVPHYIARVDFENISNLGHRLKGSGGLYGFTFISELGDRLEKAAETGNIGDAERASAELKKYLKEVEIRYE